MWKKYIIFFFGCSWPVWGTEILFLHLLLQNYTLTVEGFGLEEFCFSGPVLQEQGKNSMEEKGEKVVLKGKNGLE